MICRITIQHWNKQKEIKDSTINVNISLSLVEYPTSKCTQIWIEKENGFNKQFINKLLNNAHVIIKT